MSVWALFSIINDYNQPKNNLEAWWYEKPTFETLASVLNITVDRKKGNSSIGQLLKGKEIRLLEADYRLEDIDEGKYDR